MAMQNLKPRDSSSYADNASARLWDRFGEMFGARFYESFGSVPSQSWKDAVCELRADQVKAALSKIRNSGSPHPPSLPEFVALAKNVTIVHLAPSAPRYDDYHALGQKWLLGFLITHDVTQEKLPGVVAVKNRIVDQFRDSGDINGNVKEWYDVATAAFQKAAA